MGIYEQILQLLKAEFHLSEGKKYIPESKKEELKKVSDLLESFCDEQDIKQIELVAGTGNGALYISVYNEDFIAEHGRSNRFFRLVTLASTVSFTQCSDSLLCMKLQFNGVVKESQ